jgi:hypothetical protein
VLGALGAVASVVLGAVFLVAAVAKFARPAQWRAQATELVLTRPTEHVRLFDAVPTVEATLGALLVVQWHRQVVATVAVLVIVGFSALLVVRLLQGRRPPCACLGALRTRPIGWGSVARNAFLLALALLAALA